MSEKYFEQWKEECLIHNRSVRTAEAFISNDVDTLIETATHIRNKAIIALLYSSSLRVGELVNLKAEDICISRMQVYVPKSKNHRDRWTIQSNRALEILTDYWVSPMNNPITIQDVFRQFLPEYSETHLFSEQQHMIVLCISKRRTAEIGANVTECESCQATFITIPAKLCTREWR